MSNTVVRTNVLALNSHRNLGMVGLQQSKASARLSSGFRINSAADDAAGLGISEKMRSQIRGLDQASRNGQDGISLIQTAEGAMSTINDMVTRIRELVVQAANDTNAHEDDNLAQSDRVRIQDEINQLMDEIDATRNRTQFNTRNLIDGSLGSGQVTSSNRPGNSSSINFGDLFKDMDEMADALESMFGTSGGGNIINGFYGQGDRESTFDGSDLQDILDGAAGSFNVIGGNKNAAARLMGQALQEALANAIGFTGFKHMNNASTDQEIKDNAQAWANAVSDWLKTNNAAAGSATAGTGDISNFSDLFDKYANDKANMTQDQIAAAESLMSALKGTNMNDFIEGPPRFNHLTNETSGNAIFSGDHMNWGELNVNPRNQKAAQNAINAFIIQFAAKTLGITDGSSAASVANLENLINWFNTNKGAGSDDIDDLNGVLNALMNTSSTSGQFFITDSTGNWDGYNAAKELMQGIDDIIGQYSGNNVTGSGGSGNALWFQIGANRDQGVHLSIEDVGTAALSNIGLNGQKAGEIGEGFSFADLRTSSSIAGIQTGSGVVLQKGEDIQKFITAIDEALAHVTGQRSLLGAMQNRLEYTIENLDIASENLSAAESRIRDADMAKEMMSLTQANVLQQAAISMLAQANQAPQSVLQLLG